jgi:Fe-S cluster biosynthesis and repair protein YggX
MLELPVGLVFQKTKSIMPPTEIGPPTGINEDDVGVSVPGPQVDSRALLMSAAAYYLDNVPKHIQDCIEDNVLTELIPDAVAKAFNYNNAKFLLALFPFMTSEQQNKYQNRILRLLETKIASGNFYLGDQETLNKLLQTDLGKGLQNLISNHLISISCNRHYNELKHCSKLDGYLEKVTNSGLITTEMLSAVLNQVQDAQARLLIYVHIDPAEITEEHTESVLPNLEAMKDTIFLPESRVLLLQLLNTPLANTLMEMFEQNVLDNIIKGDANLLGRLALYPKQLTDCVFTNLLNKAIAEDHLEHSLMIYESSLLHKKNEHMQVLLNYIVSILYEDIMNVFPPKRTVDGNDKIKLIDYHSYLREGVLNSVERNLPDLDYILRNIFVTPEIFKDAHEMALEQHKTFAVVFLYNHMGPVQQHYYAEETLNYLLSRVENIKNLLETFNVVERSDQLEVGDDFQANNFSIELKATGTGMFVNKESMDNLSYVLKCLCSSNMGSDNKRELLSNIGELKNLLASSSMPESSISPDVVIKQMTLVLSLINNVADRGEEALLG